MNIGVLIAELMDPYQQELIRGIREEAEKRNYKLICFLSGALDHDYAVYKDRNRVIQEINSRSVDCLIIFSGPVGMSCGKEGLQKFISTLDNIPVISIGAELEGVISITTDNYTGFYDLVSHFISKHKMTRPGFLIGPRSNIEVQIRIKAFQEALRDNGIPYDEDCVVEGNFTPGDGVIGVDTLFDRKVEIDGLICTDDITAIEAMSRLIDQGFRIPEDIPVGGFDDEERGQYFIPSLSTVRQSPLDQGRMALLAADQELRGEKPESSIVLDSTMVLRESCGCSQSESTSLQSSEDNTDEDADLLGLINEAERRILREQKRDHHDDCRHIKTLADHLRLCLETGHPESIAPLIRKTMAETYSSGYTASYWNSILDDFSQSFGRNEFARDMVCAAGTELYKTEFRLSSFRHLDNELLNGYLIRMGDRLLTTFSEEEIKKVLREDLSTIHLDSLMIFRISKEGETRELFFSYGMDHLELENKTELSHVLNDRSDRTSYIILPLSSDKKPLGTVLMKMGRFPYSFYEYIAEKAAASLKNAELMKQLNNYTHFLEQKVSERTKELEIANRRLFDLSHKDQLTGLFNRRYLNEHLQKQLENQTGLQRRCCDSPPIHRYALVMVDLDHFKKVNDTHGHAAGDLVLQRLGKVFRIHCRDDDYIIRMGGEEFLIIYRDFDESVLRTKLEDLRQAIEKAPFIINEEVTLYKTCSLGAAMFPLFPDLPNLLSFQETLEIADRCLYRAKESGRNKYVTAVAEDKPVNEDLGVSAVESLIESGHIHFS